MVLNAIARQPIYELVAEEIKRYIIDRKLRPGDKLPTEKELCEVFGVSRSSVREAVKSLQSLGIIETKQKEGPVVRKLGSDALVDYLTFGLQFGDPTVMDLIEARRVVELGVLPLVIRKATPDDFADMDRAILAMESCDGDLHAHVKADQEFHQTLIKASKNKALGAFADVVAKFFEMMGKDIERARVDQPRVIREHKALLAALRDKDLGRATEVLERHLAWYTETVKEVREAGRQAE